VGRLTYDNTTAVDFDDRLLAHLQVVIGTKLRRGEAFYLNWTDSTSIGGGRSAIWLHPAIPIRFKYDGSRRPRLNREWITVLMISASSTEGLRPTPEPAESSSEVLP
jgi:hypothetical protein